MTRFGFSHICFLPCIVYPLFQKTVSVAEITVAAQPKKSPLNDKLNKVPSGGNTPGICLYIDFSVKKEIPLGLRTSPLSGGIRGVTGYKMSLINTLFLKTSML